MKLRLSTAFFFVCFSLISSTLFAAGGQLRANVDDLPIRSSPAIKGEKIDFVKEGTLLYFLDESSGPNLKITIRGISYDAPWYKVSTPEGMEGWVFRGSVRWLSGKNGKSDFDSQKVEGLKNYIGQQSSKDIRSIRRVLDYFNENFELDDPQTANQAYILIQEFMHKVSYGQSDIIYSGEDFGRMIELSRYDSGQLSAAEIKKVENYVASLKSNGLLMEDDGEGGVYVGVDLDLLRQRMSIYLGADLARFLEQSYLESKEGYSADAGLVISAQKVAERAIWWERFKEEIETQGRFFEMAENTQYQFENYFYTLFHGMDNTPAFDWGSKPEDQKLYKEFREAFEWAAKQEGTSTATFARLFLGQLAKNNYTLNKELEALRQDAYDRISKR